MPSKPRRVSAYVINPRLAGVEWLPPRHLNGRKVSYEVHWQTEGSPTGVRQKGEQPVPGGAAAAPLAARLRRLAPNETYTIWVRAYSETNGSFADSDRARIATYPEPGGPTLTDRTAYAMTLAWEMPENASNCTVEYAPITSNDWTGLETIEGRDR